MSKFEVGQRVRFTADGIGRNQKKGAEARVTAIDADGFPILSTDSTNHAVGWRHSVEIVFAPHYTSDSTGKDYLARCEDTFSREEMIGAYRFTLGKYVDRMGKKTGEPVEKELAKIIDYATRAKAWLEGGE